MYSGVSRGIVRKNGGGPAVKCGKNTNIKAVKGKEHSVFIDKLSVLCYYGKGNFCVKLVVC
ncbi:MAG TPA: hypothetical protein DEA44_16140 [Firmicutes bacterium]|nr:hypothetical protein [Bacillota bacterium]